MKTFGRMVRGIVAASVMVAGLSAPALAQQDFYAGKTVRLIVSFPPGDAADRTTRLIAEFLPKYIPGKPLVIVENMAGAGGVVGANHIFNVAPKDGTVVGVFNTALPTQQLIGQEGVAYKVNDYNWVGALTSVRMVCFATRDTDIHSMDDLLKPRSVPIRFGAAGVGNVQTTLANFVRLAGGQVRIIPGYPSIQQIYLALEQGELQAACSPWEGMRIVQAAQLKSGALRVFVQDGDTKASDLPDAQLMVTALKDPEIKNLWASMTRPEVAARPMALPPGVPADRVTMIRRAYDSVMKDPDFRAAAAKTGDAVNPVTGEDVQALVASIMTSSPEVVAKLKTLYGK